MPALNQEDRKLLDRISLSIEQRFIVEQHWEKEEKKKVGWMMKVLAYLLLPTISATFVAALFMPTITPLVNVATLATWLLCILSVVIFGLQMVAAVLLQLNDERQEREKLLGRAYLGTLASKTWYSTAYYRLLWVTLAVATAMLGFFVTSVAILLSWVVRVFCQAVTKEAINKELRKIDSSELSQMIKRVN